MWVKERRDEEEDAVARGIYVRSKECEMGCLSVRK